MLVRNLEQQYPPLTDMSLLLKDTTYYIMVLGAGHVSNKKLPFTAQISSNTLSRLVEGIRLTKLLPNSKLVTSGFIGQQNEPQAEVCKKAAIELGLPENKIETLISTTSTQTEAIEFSNKYGNLVPIIIVTDAIHMPRAMRWFKRAGLNPIPAPTNFFLKDIGSNNLRLMPKAGNIIKVEKALHEYLGVLWMKISD